MGYPLINGAPINGDDEQGSQDFLSPVSFGTPSVAVRAGPITPVSFGLASIGNPATFAYPTSIRTVRLGTPQVIALPPQPMSYMAPSLRPLSLGRPSFSGSSVAQGAGSVTAGALGTPSLRIGLPAQSLSAVVLGGGGLTFFFTAGGIDSVTFGAPRASAAYRSDGLSSARLGTPSVLLGATAAVPDALKTASFGVPGPATIARRAASLRAGRFGVPTLDRGASC